MALSHSPSIVTDGLVTYLDAANPRSYAGSGTTWTDLSGVSGNGTLSSGSYASSNMGSISGAILASIPFNNRIPTGSSQRTLCCFFNCSNSSSGCEVFGIGGNGGAGNRSALWVGTDAAIGVECQGCGVFTSNWPGLNKWVYLCAVFPAGATLVNSFKLYVNGFEPSSTSVGTNYSLNTAYNEFIVGGVPGSSGSHRFFGNISSVQLYNRALSQLEVQQNFNALRGRFNI